MAVGPADGGGRGRGRAKNGEGNQDEGNQDENENENENERVLWRRSRQEERENSASSSSIRHSSPFHIIKYHIRCSSTYLPHTHRPIDHHHHHAVRPVSDSSPIRIHSKRPFEFEASFQDSASIHPSSAVLSSSIASIVYHLSTAWRVSRSAGNGPVARTSGGLIDSAS